MKWQILLGVILGWAGVSWGAEDEPSFQVKSQSPDDRIEITIADERMTIDVRSSTGIGRASIERQAGAWPDSITLRLRLKGLESLQLAAQSVKLNASVSSHDGSVSVWMKDREEEVLDEQSPHWIRLRMLDADGRVTQGIPLKAGYFEVRLPKKLWESNPKKIEIGWIDFYR